MNFLKSYSTGLNSLFKWNLLKCQEFNLLIQELWNSSASNWENNTQVNGCNFFFVHPGIISSAYTTLCIVIFPEDLTPLLGKQKPVQTSTYLNTKHHSLVEIIKKALALKLQTRDEVGISGTRWNESLESMDCTDRLHSLMLADPGEEYSRNSYGDTRCTYRPPVPVKASVAVLPVSSPPPLQSPFPFHVPEPSLTGTTTHEAELWLWVGGCQVKRTYLQAVQPLKCWESNSTTQTLRDHDLPSRMDLSKQMLYSRNETIISRIFM